MAEEIDLRNTEDTLVLADNLTICLQQLKDLSKMVFVLPCIWTCNQNITLSHAHGVENLWNLTPNLQCIRCNIKMWTLDAPTFSCRIPRIFQDLCFTICAVAVPRWDKKHQIHDLGDLSTLGPARTAAALGLAPSVEAHLLAPVAQVRRHGK